MACPHLVLSPTSLLSSVISISLVGQLSAEPLSLLQFHVFMDSYQITQDAFYMQQILPFFPFTYFLFVLFRAIPGCAQGLPLTLHSGITPGRIQGTIWYAMDWTRLVACKTSTLSTVLSSSPICFRKGKPEELSRWNLIHPEVKNPCLTTLT